MTNQWESKKMYEHPAEHQKGVFGKIALSEAGVYILRIGSVVMSCPQIWAAKIHHSETEAKV